MRATYQGTDQVKIHFDWETRLIWYVDETGEVRQTDMGPEAFATMAAERLATVQVLGFHTNAELICRLYEVCQKHESPPVVEIGTPAVCSRSERSNPQLILRRMAEVGALRSSLGGWHRLTREDFASYLLICAFLQNDGQVTDVVQEVLAKHPAYDLLSFIPTTDWAAAAAVLTYMVDPRWYVDVENPDRGSRLRAYFGLTKSNARTFLTGNGRAGLNYDRATLAFQSWRQTPKADQELPANFLWRRMHSFADPALGVLRATSTLIDMLAAVWLAKLGTHPELRASDHLFDFDVTWRPVVVQAFREHVVSLRNI